MSSLSKLGNRSPISVLHKDNGDVDFEYAFKSMQHEYAMLENQFQLYSSETLQKIAGLEQDIDRLISEKDLNQKVLSQQNLDLKDTNFHLQQQIKDLHTQIYQLQHQIKVQQDKIKLSGFDIKNIEILWEQKIECLEKQLSLRNCSLESIKEILNNERINMVRKEQQVRQRDNEISRMQAQLKTMHNCLDQSLINEEEIKDTNYRLKKELEELKTNFVVMQNQMQTCASCKYLRFKNCELEAIIQGFRREQNYPHLKKQEFSKKSRSNFNHEPLITSKYYLPKSQMRNITNSFHSKRQDHFTDYKRSRKSSYVVERRLRSSMKESVLEKCLETIERGM